jgi:DNA-binding NtrC family response regulator
MERALLERLGHQAICVQNAHQAELALDQDESLTVSLLITDFALVDTSGSDLAGRVRERNPALKVLYTSGSGKPPDGYARLRADGVQFLPKPFSAAEFLSCVSKLLP